MDRGDKKSLIKYNYELFAHHIYELNKGLRHLVLHTAPVDTMGYMVKKLEKNSISFFVQKVSNDKCNLFFGEKECIDIIKKFNKTSLKKYTPEEDFILGILLSYDPLKQSKRYLKFKTDSN